MCDYSLHHVSSRPAKVADKLVTMELAKSNVRGFAAVGELGAKLVIHDSPPEVAVCLLPGTELAFDENVRYDRPFSFVGIGFFGKARLDHKVASFRKVDLDDPHVQHDALEFPNGQVLKIAQLVAGQTATVLQLPVAVQHDDEHEHAHGHPRARSLALNRTSSEPGLASILVPNQGAVMLWDAVRGKAIELSTSLVESFQRLAHKQPSLSEAILPADIAGIEANFDKGAPSTKTPEKTVKVPAA